MSEGFGAELVQNYAVYIASISAAITGLAVIYSKGIKPMVKAISNYRKTLEKIDKIFVEITPNGGTSIKDKIDRMDRNLALASARQKAMAADTSAALFETDSVGNCVWVNRTYTRVAGLGFSQILGHGWQNTIAPDERERVVSEWYTAVEQNREFSMEFNFETPDGHKTLCRCRSYKLVDNKGELLGYWGNCKILS